MGVGRRGRLRIPIAAEAGAELRGVTGPLRATLRILTAAEVEAELRGGTGPLRANPII